MKNKYIYMAALLLGTSLGFTACSDDDDATGASDREFMTMFRTDNNTGKGDSDPYKSQIVDMNDVQLYWYGVNGAAGYQVRMALQPNVSNGAAAWEESAQKGLLLLDTIVGPDVLELKIKDLQYATSYRFAIRTLSPQGEGHHSKWYGYGDGRQWADWFGLDTDERYTTPAVIYASDVTKTSMRIHFDRAFDNAGTDEEKEEMAKHFTTDADGNFVFDKFTVEASPTNPDAVVPEQFKSIQLTEADFQRGYIDVEGLAENSVYNFNVEDTKMANPCRWDRIYNTLVMRTDGEPGEPILIPWSCNPNDFSEDADGVRTTIPGVADYQACKLDSVIMNFNKDSQLAEGQIFELEGGKTYYTYMNVELCKGFTLRTRPEDLAAGKGRARVLLGGIAKKDNGACYASNNFMFGRRPQSGELGSIYIKTISFEDIDFDCPTATNFGEGNAQGNYFVNMYSDGMGVTLQSFEMHRCSLQRMIRGFIRVQGKKVKKFEKVLIEDCDFYNCGYYDNNGRGYAWVAGDGSNAKSNIFGNFIFRGNTFYDSPRTCLITDNGKDLSWAPDVAYNITVENNTFVNFSTRSTGRKIFDLRYMPGGSKITCRKNLFVLARKDGDTDRNLYLEGADIRTINGSGVLNIDFGDNYSTNIGKDGATVGDDGIFSSAAFTAKKNSIGTWYTGPDPESLIVRVGADGGLAPTELFEQPCPPNKFDPAGGPNDHKVKGIDGGKDQWTGNQADVNLHFKNTEKVHNSEIYIKGVGAPKWR